MLFILFYLILKGLIKIIAVQAQGTIDTRKLQSSVITGEQRGFFRILFCTVQIYIKTHRIWITKCRQWCTDNRIAIKFQIGFAVFFYFFSTAHLSVVSIPAGIINEFSKRG